MQRYVSYFPHFIPLEFRVTRFGADDDAHVVYIDMVIKAMSCREDDVRRDETSAAYLLLAFSSKVDAGHPKTFVGGF